MSDVHEGMICLSSYDSEGNITDQLYDVHGNLVLPNENLPEFNSSGQNFIDGVMPTLSGESLLIDTQGRTIIPNLKYMLANGDNFHYSNGRVYPFDNGVSLLTLSRWDFLVPGYGGVETKLHYLLEIHEGTYTGPGVVYDAATGAIRDGGTTPVDPEPAGDQPSSWAAEQVNAAIAAGLVPEALQAGYTSTATRAQFCALAVELYETVTGSEIAQRAEFTDTTDVNVQKMAGIGVINGVGNGQFNPSGQLTREQAATILVRLADAMGHPLPEGTASFADNASIASWALDAVGRAQAGGLMGGIGNNQFSPQGAYTVEQSIMTAFRLYETVQ